MKNTMSVNRQHVLTVLILAVLSILSLSIMPSGIRKITVSLMKLWFY